VKIGIIGAGSIGATLTRKLAALGHDVSVANSRGPETLAELAAETGATATPITEVVRGVDVVFVAIPFKRVPDLPTGLFRNLPAHAALVDAGNYVPQQRDGRIEEIETGLVESRWTERHYGHPVVKAFNTLAAKSLAGPGKPAGTPGRIAIPVAGDDARAKGVVMELADQLGYDPVDAGGLDESWRQQPGTAVFTADLDAEHTRKALAEASPERPAAWRA
jgi:predicted dinucleotide-binding enzyme